MKIIILLLSIYSFKLYATGDVGDPHFKQMLINEHIYEHYTLEGHDHLVGLFKDRISDLERLDKSDSDVDSKMKILNHGLDVLSSITDETSIKDRTSRYLVTQRMLYTVSSMDYLNRKLSFKELVTMPFRIISRLTTTFPYVDEKDLDKPIGKIQAGLETKFLVDPKMRNEFVSFEKLKKMSVREISELEIGESHPHWYSRSFMKNHKKPWKNLEEYAQKEVTKLFNDEIKYDLKSAKSVLFYSKIKNSATSAKMTVKDAYGMKWKLKWGMETQTEPVANRLYAYLGAKWSDLVYANERGIDGTVLILDKKDDGCKKIKTTQRLISCLKDSKYKFNLTPYILEEGILTKDNVSSVLRNYPDDSVVKKSRKELIGRAYVTFKTSMVEFNAKNVLAKGGSTAGSSLGAPDDRVARGLLLFNAWIANNDAKDENNKGLLLENFNGNDQVYVETQHDLGSSFALAGSAGDISSLSTYDKFMKIEKNPLLDKKVVRFGQVMLYRPKAWAKVTHADALWMVRQIIALPYPKLQEAVESTLWPDFMKDLFLYKLDSRRETLAKIYGLPFKRMATLPKMSIDLSTNDSKSELAEKYHFNVEKLNNFLETFNANPKVETILNKGKVAKCSKSYFIDFMEQEVFPEGLSRRQKRGSDDVALKVCHKKDEAKRDPKDIIFMQD